MHDMLAAHAWVALVIYYRETHNFDIRNMAPTTETAVFVMGMFRKALS